MAGSVGRLGAEHDGVAERIKAADQALGGAVLADTVEDHAFPDMLRQAARERDAPPATFNDPGVVALADRELARALVLIERAGSQTVRQVRLAVRQLLAERDRVLREPAIMRLPPVAPEKLAGVIRKLVATLEQGLAVTSKTLPMAAPPAPTEPAHLGAAGPA